MPAHPCHTVSRKFQAENHPPAYEDEFGIHGDYDPINVSLGLHLALLNILQRFILLLGMNNR